MKKNISTFALLLISVMAFAQNPKLSYQAVVRDSQNKLVVEQPVAITVNVLKSDNSSQFEQTLNATTNRNGLMSLEIGDETAAWSNIDWEGARIRTAVTLADGTEMVDTANVNAVPSALFANNVSDEVLDKLTQAQASQIGAFQQNLDSLSNLFFDYAYLDDKPCPLTSTVSDGSNTYPTVVIGKQCWMAQNLRTTAGLNYRTDYFHVNNNANNDEEYGLLYTWYAATHNQTQDEGHPMVRGICPEGWHIPSQAEWSTMTSYINSRPTQFKHCGDGNIASALASKTGWSGSSEVDCSPAKTPSANNTTGFNILPAGIYLNGPSDYGTSAYFWSASQLAYNYAYHIRFFNNSAAADIDNFDMSGAFSVRCLRNTEVVSSSQSASPTISCDDVKACLAENFNKYTPTAQLCDVVNNCDLSSNASIANLSTLLQGLSNQMENMNEKMDSLNHLVDSLSNQAPVRSFICGNNTVDDHEGNTYNTVKIGNQCWIKENMRCTTSPSTGSTILDRQEEISYSGKKAYYYDNTTSNAANGFGLLYNWCAAVDTFNTAMDETSTSTSNEDAPDVTFTGNRRGICPQGWHVPSDADWTQLKEYLCTQSEYLCGTYPMDIAKSLASTEYWEIDSFHNCAVGNMPNENNKSGFSALPAGERTDYSYDFRGSNAFFWSATQTNPVNAHYLSISNTGATTMLNENYKNYAHSVRCLRDGGVTGKAGANEMQPSPTSTSCEDVMNCLGDTLGKLNEKIEAQNAELEAQTHQIDSLLQLADALSIFHPFACGDSITDADNNKYPTVKIGTQCWMAQNLRTTKKPDGTPLSDTDYYKVVNIDEHLENSDEPSNYGYLYKWNVMMNGSDLEGGQGLCPDGWHVPSKTEWETMTSYVKRQPSYLCGNQLYSFVWPLISTTGWEERPTTEDNDCVENFNGNGTNLTGFNAFPAGFYDVLSRFTSHKGMNAYFWSSSSTYDDQNQLNNSHYLWINNLPDMEIEDKNKENGLSVRCIKD